MRSCSRGTSTCTPTSCSRTSKPSRLRWRSATSSRPTTRPGSCSWRPDWCTRFPGGDLLRLPALHGRRAHRRRGEGLMAAVSFQELKKNFGHTRVLHGISLEIADGEFMVLVGPSGCGKSTLLRMLAGLEDISAGSIAIDDRVVNDLESKDRDIAMVFQSYALYPHMTVRDNMGFSLKLRKDKKTRIDERVARTAKILNLEPYLNRYPRELSGGQRQ